MAIFPPIGGGGVKGIKLVKREQVTINYGGDQHQLWGIKNDLITNEWKSLQGFYETDLLGWLDLQELQGVYVDVGAHVGNHTVFFSQHCPSTTVYAFEPQAELYRTLTQNTWKLENVKAFRYAVHDSYSYVDIQSGPVNNWGMGKVKQRTAEADDDESNDVYVARLDDVVQGPVAVIKLDVEGDEAAALSTATGILAKDSPVICCEVLDQDAQDVVEAVLSPFGYQHTHTFGIAPVHVYQVV